MRAVVAEPGATLDPAAIAAHADRERTRGAQPHVVEIVPDLPKTPTAKVHKAKLRKRGVGPGYAIAWSDVEAAEKEDTENNQSVAWSA